MQLPSGEGGGWLHGGCVAASHYEQRRQRALEMSGRRGSMAGRAAGGWQVGRESGGEGDGEGETGQALKLKGENSTTAVRYAQGQVAPKSTHDTSLLSLQLPGQLRFIIYFLAYFFFFLRASRSWKQLPTSWRAGAPRPPRVGCDRDAPPR